MSIKYEKKTHKHIYVSWRNETSIQAKMQQQKNKHTNGSSLNKNRKSQHIPSNNQKQHEKQWQANEQEKEKLSKMRAEDGQQPSIN